MALRYDMVTLRKPERTAQGFLRADAPISRTGIQHYKNADGSTRREYRPPDEVFHADALKSFEDAPITMDHPARLVTKDTVKDVAVGTVKAVPRRDGDWAVSPLLVTDASAIEAVESGRNAAVSCGYECDYDPTPGTAPNGDRYDGVQRNIRGNHLALVPAGRAGPEARIRLDAADAVQVSDATDPQPKPRKESSMLKKIRIDGLEVEVTEHAAQVIERQQARVDGEAEKFKADLKAAREDADKARAKADQLEADAKKRADAASPEALAKLVKARTELLGTARSVLGEERTDELKIDDLADIAVKKAVVLGLSPEAKLDGKSDAYIEARFDQAVEQHNGDDHMAEVREDADKATRRTAVEDGELVTKARQDAIERTNAAWKQPLSASKDAKAS